MSFKIVPTDKNYRVHWRHLGSNNQNTYPKQEPLYTYEEAEQAVKEENSKGYLIAHIIDRQGLQC